MMWAVCAGLCFMGLLMSSVGGYMRAGNRPGSTLASAISGILIGLAIYVGRIAP